MHLKSKSPLSSDLSSAIADKSFRFSRIVPLAKIFFFSSFNKGLIRKKYQKNFVVFSLQPVG